MRVAGKKEEKKERGGEEKKKGERRGQQSQEMEKTKECRTTMCGKNMKK